MGVTHFFFVFVATCCCVCGSNGQNFTDEVTNVRRIFNESELASLREEAFANFSVSVSNTSLLDLQHDNDTIRLQHLYRERKKQERLLSIQNRILLTRRLANANSTLPTLTDSELTLISETYERLVGRNNSTNTATTESSNNT